MASRQQQRFQHTIEAGVHVLDLALPFQVDSSDFDKINESVGELVSGATKGELWVLDLTHVEYIGSALLGMLVNLRQRVLAGGKLVLCGLNNQVTKALRTCSLHNLFTITEKREAAVRRAISP